MLNLTFHSKLIHKDVNKKRKAFLSFCMVIPETTLTQQNVCLIHQGEKIRSMLECKDYSRISPAFSIFHNRKVVKKREKPVLSLILFLGMTFKFKGI